MIFELNKGQPRTNELAYVLPNGDKYFLRPKAEQQEGKRRQFMFLMTKYGEEGETCPNFEVAHRILEEALREKKQGSSADAAPSRHRSDLQDLVDMLKEKLAMREETIDSLDRDNRSLKKRVKDLEAVLDEMEAELKSYKTPEKSTSE